MTPDVTITDVSAFQRKHIRCPLCKKTGMVMLTGEHGESLWNTTRPCPICKGVGQIHQNRIPTMEEIAEKMINYKFD